MQLVAYLAALGLDAEQVVCRSHAGRTGRFRLPVECVHLGGIAFKHTHFPTHRDAGPVSLVSLNQYVHACHALLFEGDVLADPGEAPACPYLPAGIEGLREVEVGHVHAAHPELHAEHVDVRRDIGTHGRGVELGQSRGGGNLDVELRLADAVAGLFQVLAVGQRPGAAVGQADRLRGLRPRPAAHPKGGHGEQDGS